MLPCPRKANHITDGELDAREAVKEEMPPPSDTGLKEDVPAAAPASAEDAHDDLEKRFPLWDKAVSALGIELQGSEPVRPHKQTDRRYLRLCTLWFSMNFNLIA